MLLFYCYFEFYSFFWAGCPIAQTPKSGYAMLCSYVQWWALWIRPSFIWQQQFFILQPTEPTLFCYSCTIVPSRVLYLLLPALVNVSLSITHTCSGDHFAICFISTLYYFFCVMLTISIFIMANAVVFLWTCSTKWIHIGTKTIFLPYYIFCI